MQRKKASSLDNFQAFYSEQFGKDWPSILESLRQTTQHCAVVNKFSSQEEVHEKLSSTEAEFLNVSIFNSHEDIQNELQLKCYFPNSSNRVRFPKQDKTSNGYFDYYLLDASSMLPVLALDIDTNNAVLDMCAAPGGKTVLVSQLLSNHGSLVASEISNTRRANLIKVGAMNVCMMQPCLSIVYMLPCVNVTTCLPDANTNPRTLPTTLTQMKFLALMEHFVVTKKMA